MGNKSHKQKDLKIGNVIFYNNIQKNSISPYAIQQFSKSKWWLYNRFKNQKWNELLQIMKQADVVELQLSQIEQKNIIKTISHIYFSSLRMITLAENKIQNIQALQFMNFYLVQSLNLQENNISCIKGLCKTYFPNLINLNLSKNPVILTSQLSKCYLNQYNEYLDLRQNINKYFTKGPILNDMSVLAKLCIKVCDKINIQSHKSIYQFKVTKMIVKAYDVVDIKQWIEDDRQLRIFYKLKMKEATQFNQ